MSNDELVGWLLISVALVLLVVSVTMTYLDAREVSRDARAQFRAEGWWER